MNGPQSPFGFPHQMRPEGAAPAPVVPSRLPKRPRGRWFIGAVLLLIYGLASYAVWHAYFRYQAYGVVTGRVVTVSPPWDGFAQYIHVQEGQHVRQGELLITVDNTELRHRYAQLGEEARIQQALLAAEASKLKLQAAFNMDQTVGTLTQYLESSGQLLQEKATLENLKVQLDRAKALLRYNAVAQQEVDQLYFAVKGQQRKVAQLEAALAKLKSRADHARELLSDLSGEGSDQLKPILARIEAANHERARVQQLLNEGQLRAPADGLVVRIDRFPGEFCKKGEPIIQLLQKGSMHVLLYMPQDASDLLDVDDETELVIEPYSEPLRCRVTKKGDELVSAPSHLARFYNKSQKLLPLKLEITNRDLDAFRLRVNDVVKLPYLGATIIKANERTNE
ncbi:MAG: multidrug resistance protein [Gemmatales bacterium]|nr:MAG: multidrug resistance protein [Gemmatales bacterium]